MKKIFISLLALVSFASPALAADPSLAKIQTDIAVKQMNIAGFTASVQYQEYTGAARMESAIEDVMKMNGISHEQAVARYIAAIISESGTVGRNPLYPDSHMAFDPAYQAWKDAGGSFYSGFDLATGRHMMTDVQRSSVLMQNFWYCPQGQDYIYGETASVCK